MKLSYPLEQDFTNLESEMQTQRKKDRYQRNSQNE